MALKAAVLLVLGMVWKLQLDQRFIFALGIREVGETTAKTLARHYGSRMF